MKDKTYGYFLTIDLFQFLFIRIFAGHTFGFIGQMADTPLAIETLIERFGGKVCSKFRWFFCIKIYFFIVY
jgi:hypothetical protein